MSEDDALMHIAGAWCCYYNCFPSWDGEVALWFGNKDRAGKTAWSAGGNIYSAKDVEQAVLRFLDRFPDAVTAEKRERIIAAIGRLHDKAA